MGRAAALNPSLASRSINQIARTHTPTQVRTRQETQKPQITHPLALSRLATVNCANCFTFSRTTLIPRSSDALSSRMRELGVCEHGQAGQ